MQKIILIIIIQILPIILFSQQILTDISNYTSSVINNGLTIITVETNEFEYLNYRLIFDIEANINNDFIGTTDVFNYLLGFEKTSIVQLSKNMVSDKTAIDSTFIFLNETVISPKFNKKTVYGIKQHILSLLKSGDNTLSDFRNTSRVFCFGQDSPYTCFADSISISNTDISKLAQLHSTIINPHNAYLIVVGQIKHDSIVKYANRNFANWQSENQLSNSSAPVIYTNSTIINQVDKSTSPMVSLSYPLNFFYTDNDFFDMLINGKVLENRTKNMLNNYAKNINFTLSPGPVTSELFISYDTKKKYLYNTISESVELIKDLQNNNQTVTEINIAKSELTKEFNSSLKNPYNIAQYTYYLQKYKLPHTFFTYYVTKINAFQISEENHKCRIFKPESTSIVVFGKKTELTCQMFNLSQFFNITFLDNNLKKTDILNKGFDCNTIIDNFLKKCNARKKYKNISIKFKAEYLADTIYIVEGVIYRKEPNLYYYKTELILENDTLLQNLIIANETQGLDSCALDTEHCTREEILPRIFASYVFSELYYSELGFSTNLVCDTSLLQQNIYKIKVNTPFDISYYNYYDATTNEKIKTETIILKNNRYETIQITEFSDYKETSKNSKLIMPFSINQIVGSTIFSMKLLNVNTKKHIRNNIFEIKQP